MLLCCEITIISVQMFISSGKLRSCGVQIVKSAEKVMAHLQRLKKMYQSCCWSNEIANEMSNVEHAMCFGAQEVYMSATAILLGVVACPERAASVAANAQTVKQLESLGQLLIRKLDMESKYLNRLEGVLPLFWGAQSLLCARGESTPSPLAQVCRL